MDLILWRDHDGDRRSSHWEHETLASYGIIAIPIDFTRRRDCDARGNCGIERAIARLRDGATAEVVDLHLPCH